MKKIPSRARCCCRQAEPFGPGSHYVSTLCFKKGDWVREDFCLNCAAEISKEEYSWRGTIPLKKQKAYSADEEAYTRFCDEGSEPQVRFLLALYLVRRGMLERRGADLFEEPQTGELFKIAATAIPEGIEQQLSSLFETSDV